MDQKMFHETCVEASKTAVSQPGRIGRLKLSMNDAGESLMRAPEMVHAFARTLA
jgi:hypothetical protein